MTGIISVAVLGADRHLPSRTAGSMLAVSRGQAA